MEWLEGTPKKSKLENGLPTLYLCQILILDATFGYRYTYSVGYVNDDGDWNLKSPMRMVTRYCKIDCQDKQDHLQYLKDIERHQKEQIV